MTNNGQTPVYKTQHRHTENSVIRTPHISLKAFLFKVAEKCLKDIP